ncbi:prepilin-type N-terminal cleavage/methylation domain-containing protein [Moraxella marmotae]|uniref:prepilin-type N-terminal cleavage/methylation domain-containing protein n=1 Tax=Moraxella marmotae TaxID=3344520 RepID=UPI0035F3F190
MSHQQMTDYQRGMSLLEVLVALTLLSVVVLGLLSVQARLSVRSENASQHAKAVQLIGNDYHAVRAFSDEQKHSYARQLNQLAGQANGTDAMSRYRRAAHAVQMSCHQGCQPDDYAKWLASQTAQTAADFGIVIGVVPCQMGQMGQAGQCWVAAWGNDAMTKLRRCQIAQKDNLAHQNNCVSMGGL